MILIQLLENGLDKHLADKIQSEIWDYFENKLIPTVYYDKQVAEEEPAAEEEPSVFTQLANCLVDRCKKLSKSEVCITIIYLNAY